MDTPPLYLELDDDAEFPYRTEDVGRCGGETYYRLWPESIAVLAGWFAAENGDYLSCGVLADFLDENRGHLLSTATGPEPEDRLDRLIANLRNQCCNPV
jgi:hypothetical protein